MNKMNISIDIKESTAIKGILIILIILGHAQPLIQISEVFRRFFYDFHVHCFMILPLLYPVKQLSRERVKNYVARLIIPYILLFVVFYIGMNIPVLLKNFHSNILSLYDVKNFITKGVKSMIMGGYFPLGDSIKLRYLWFLPAMFSFTIIKDYYKTTSSKMTKIAFLFLGSICYFILWVCLYPPFFEETKKDIMNNSPISIWQAIGALFMGVATVYLLRIVNLCKLRKLRMFMKIALPILFITIYGLYTIIPKTSGYLLPLKTIIPIIAFLLLYDYRKVLAKSKILRKFGEHSFEIYLVQTPICIIMYTCLPMLISTELLIVRAFLFVLILVVCYYVAYTLMHLKITKRFLCPKTWNEFMGRI